MTNKRISQLDALTGAGSANDDNLVIFDTSTSTTKRILRSQLAIGLAGDLPYTPSGSISATTIPTAIAELDTEKAPLASPTFTGIATIPDLRIVTGINDTNGNELVNVTAVASAVNEITVANAATGAGPTISTTGDDSNVNLNIALKGTGVLALNDAVNVSFGTSTGTKLGTSTSQKVGFFGVTPVVQQTELTDELTSITHTAPGTPDYAIQDLTSTSPFGFVTKNEGNTVLSVIANLQARVNELETKLVAYGLLPDAD